jgi:drug/metabolite transporter (DMT)-like permease
VDNSPYWIGPLAALMSSVTWAVGSNAYSKLARSNSAFAVNFTRGIFALPCFLIVALVVTGGFVPLYHAFRDVHLYQLGWFGASMFASYAFGDSIFIWAAHELGVPGTLAIGSIFPVWTAIAGYFFLGQTLTILQIFGLLMAVAGVVVVIINGPKLVVDESNAACRDENKSQSNPGVSEVVIGEIGEILPPIEIHKPGNKNVARGVFLAIVTSFMWALNSYAVNRGAQGMSAIVGNAIRMSIAPFLVFGISRLLGYRGRMTVPFNQVAHFSWAFFLEVFGGSYFYMYGLVHAPLAIGPALTGLAPVIAVPVALGLKLEKFSFPRTFGICLVVVGICFLVGGGARIG